MSKKDFANVFKITFDPQVEYIYRAKWQRGNSDIPPETVVLGHYLYSPSRDHHCIEEQKASEFALKALLQRSIGSAIRRDPKFFDVKKFPLSASIAKSSLYKEVAFSQNSEYLTLYLQRLKK